MDALRYDAATMALHHIRRALPHIDDLKERPEVLRIYPLHVQSILVREVGEMQRMLRQIEDQLSEIVSYEERSAR